MLIFMINVNGNCLMIKFHVEVFREFKTTKYLAQI